MPAAHNLFIELHSITHKAPNTRTAAIAISSSTALFYKDLEGTETSDETQQQQQEEMFVRSKKRNNKQLFKKSHLKEYELGATADGDIEDQLNNNNSHDNVDRHDMGIMKQNSLLLDKHPSLVLNADYQPLRMLPLSTWSWQNTVKAVLSGKAVVVDVYPDLYVRAVSLDIPVPSVIALREYAPTGKAKPAFTRRNVFLRDGYRCQYCSHLFRTTDLSLDHVMPRCLGGKLTWDNTVTCCKKCNGRKGSLLPTQLDVVGMELRREPRRPSLYELAAEAGRFVPRRVHPTWEPFLGGGNREKED
eukprot:scaffold2990_cov104-Skeletonema_marinoi.AAC.3